MKNVLPRNKLKGFTLIELIVTMLILSTLAVIALPKYVSISSDAHVAIVENLKSTLRTSANNYHLKATLMSSDATISNGFTYQGVYFDQGYPIGMSYGDNDNIPEILETIEFDQSIAYQEKYLDSTSDGQVARGLYMTSVLENNEFLTVEEITATNCYVAYKSYLRKRKAPEVYTVTTGC